MADTPAVDWTPGAGLPALRARAQLLAAVRGFFAERDVLEVETPLLCRSTVTDPQLTPIASAERWLQTSPEFAMKRLLAAGSGPVFQVCKAFRQGEVGARHNPEFSLLEWYRPGFDLQALMNETAALVQQVLGELPVTVLEYRAAFTQQLGVDPFLADTVELENIARSKLDYQSGADDRDTWLDLLMSHLLEPGFRGITLVYHYPPSQAALARLTTSGGVSVAERFELYVDGVELANGYFELTDADEQRHRFEADNARLQEQGKPARPVDKELLAALESGLPDCAGVALGLDRLLMLKLGAERLEDVLSFDWSRC